MKIREEKAADQASIHRLTEIAFKPMKFSDGTEPDIIDRLRISGDLTISLVAENEKVIVGHVAFSPVSIGEDSCGWYGLGPVSVQPDRQGRGIGTALIKHGLQMLRDRGATGCALIGDPNYYSRFGFVSDGNVHYKDLPGEHVQWLSFDTLQPVGELQFSPAFED